MLRSNFEFDTNRLTVREWHSVPDTDWNMRPLSEVIARLLTPAVTASLPAAWQGEYSIDRAEKWIAELDEEATTLLVIEKSSAEAIGLLIVYEMPVSDDAEPEIRIGYLLAEHSWGQGFASELVNGFIDELKRSGGAVTVFAGVSADNPASVRVLEKAGFEESEPEDSADQDELQFSLRVN